MFEVDLIPTKVDQFGRAWPCLKAIRTIVASRCPRRLPFMALISRPTSRSVRCSRDRYSAFGFRRGATVDFSLAGGLGEPHNLSHLHPPPILR